jgi:hypothetical protein
MKLYVVVWEKSPEGCVQVSGRYVCIFISPILSTPVYVLSRYIARENEA